MKQTINFGQFQDAFYKMDRQHQFSYKAKKALFNWFEEYEEDCETEVELDVVAICCDFVEYDSLEDFQLDYDSEDYPDIDSIQDNTIVIPIDDDSFIIQVF